MISFNISLAGGFDGLNRSGLQAVQTIFNGLADVITVGAAGVDIIPGAAVEFCNQHDLFTAVLYQFTEDFLGAPPRIHIGAVKEVDAGFAAAAKYGYGCFLVRAAAKGHGSQAE